MKKLFLALVAICILSTFAFAQEAVTPTETATPEETVTLKGTIIDNMCAESKTSEELADFVKTYTKEQALTQDNIASGYSIYADGKLTKFDKESNAKVEEFLKREESSLEAVVTAKKVGEELSLVSIENQK